MLSKLKSNGRVEVSQRDRACTGLEGRVRWALRAEKTLVNLALAMKVFHSYLHSLAYVGPQMMVCFWKT